MLAHIAIVLVGTIVALGGWPLKIILALAASHALIDALERYVLKDSAFSFAIFAHIVVAATLAVLFPNVLAEGWWPRLIGHELNVYIAGLCLVTGTAVNLSVGAIILRKCTAQFVAQIEKPIEGLTDGGLYIGLLERALVMILILSNQAAGVGFLITAKSILRFGDVRDDHQRKSTEYIIIGTFMSFGWALIASLLTQQAIKHWLP